MKKYFYSLFAAATMLLAVTSCSQEEDLGKSSNGVTSFSISLNDKAGSRAAEKVLGKGTLVDKLYYHVFMANNDESVKYGSQDIDPTKPFKLDLPLLNGEEYKIVFWAQDSDCTIYGISNENGEDGLATISVNYADGVLANQESYDAFYNAFTITADGNTHRVELRRPFAQVNLGTSDWDKVIVPSGSSPVTKTSVKVTGLANMFVPFSGRAYANGEVGSVTFNDANLPGGELLEVKSVDEQGNEIEEKYTYLSLNYLLVPGDKTPQGYDEDYTPEDNAGKATVDLTFNFYRGDKLLENILNVPYVPVQRNWRTNIIGALLTGTSFDIEIKPDTDEDINWEVTKVSSSAEIQEAIDNASAGTPTYLEVTDNITFGVDSKALSRAAETSYISIPAGKNVVLDLKGFTISGIEDATGSFSLIKNQGTLTITNSVEKAGKLEFKAENDRGWNAYSSVVSNTVGGNLIVESGVVIEHKGGTAMAYGIDNLTNGKGTSAITTINGATVKSTYIAIRQFLNGIEATNELYVKSGILEGTKRSIWMQDPSANSNTGKLVVESSEKVTLNGVVKLSITEGSTEWPLDITIPASVIDEDSQLEYPETLPVGYSVKEIDGVYTVVVTHVAKIGEVGYTTLKKAVDAVEDGGTITLVANETFSENNRCNNSGYWDGLSYSGDKSFTIDLGGYTISQDGALNDYLIWIKNDGAKANTINLKNGTLDAGKTAYSALATASSNKQKITINLENVNLINDISNGAVVKARGGSELNVKAGTKITAMDSYTGIEAVGNNTVVNIYDGAEIYQNGTSNYVGAIVGASYNATMNIYGGKGQSAKCGIIVMSTGATINVSGGEWIANNDGTVAGGNQGVLVSQNNRYESGWACKSVMNVTGGTFKGGYDCWGMGPGQEADDAQINIKGGNFNANPSAYVVNGFKAVDNNGVWSIAIDPVAKIGSAEYATLQEAFNVGGNITLLRDVTITEPATLGGGKTAEIDLNGKTLTAELTSAFVATEGANLTVKNGNVIAYESTVRAIGGKLVVESGEYTSTGTAVDTPSTYRYSLDCRDGGELIIDGGTFKSNNGMINVGSTVTINGGKFENDVEKTMTRHFAYVSAPLTINDGEFLGKANGAAGGCFFCGAAAGGDIQVNGGKFTSLWTSGSANKIFEYYYGGTINVTGGMFNTNGGIATFVTENTDEATKAAYPYVAK